MIKVKIINEKDLEEVERKANRFMEPFPEENILDVQYSETPSGHKIIILYKSRV